MANELEGKTVLVVDDEPDIREILAEDIEMLGARVHQAANGRIAFDVCMQQKPDAIVSDVRMPGGDGIELLKRLREAMLPMPKIIYITGFADITPEEANSLGVQGMLYKPFSLKELRALLIEKLNHPATT